MALARPAARRAFLTLVRLPPALRPLFPYLKPVYVSATGAVSPLVRRARRGGWLPTGIATTLDDAARDGGSVVEARPAETIVRGIIEGLPAGLPLADPGDGEHVGRVAVAELPGGRVLGPHRAVITGSGRLVDEVSRYFGTRRAGQHPVFVSGSVPPPLDVDGRLAVLASRADSNYYHFLFDVLPRLSVLEQAGVPAPDFYYVPAETRFQRDALERLGITGSRLVDAARHPHVRASTLVVPGPPAMTEKNPPWVVAYLRKILLDGLHVAPGSRRLYVTRGPSVNNRSVTNEAAVLDRLLVRGFEAIDPGALSLSEQVTAFASASTIVAPHGAALANLAFASPGAGVVELFPAGSVLPDFWRVASGVPGLRYRYLSAPNPRRRTPSRGATIVRDIEVDLTALDRLLDELN